MEQIKRIAILGGGGRTGKFILAQLISRGYSVKALLRNPENLQLESPSIEIVKGDALDPEAIRALLQGCQAVISTVGQRKDEPLVASQATMNILSVMAAHGIKRYILVAGLNVDTPMDKKSPETIAATEWMKMTFPAIHEDRQKTYSILSISDVNWTMVRVPYIEFTETLDEIRVSLEDCCGSKIGANEIANFVMEQLTNEAYVMKAPFIASV